MDEGQIISHCKRFVSGEAQERIAARQWLIACGPFLSVADEFRKTGYSFAQVAGFIASDDLQPLGKLATQRLRTMLAATSPSATDDNEERGFDAPGPWTVERNG